VHEVTHVLYFKRLHHDLDSMVCPAPQRQMDRLAARRVRCGWRSRSPSGGQRSTQIVIDITVPRLRKSPPRRVKRDEAPHIATRVARHTGLQLNVGTAR